MENTGKKKVRQSLVVVDLVTVNYDAIFPFFCTKDNKQKRQKGAQTTEN